MMYKAHGFKSIDDRHVAYSTNLLNTAKRHLQRKSVVQEFNQFRDYDSYAIEHATRYRLCIIYGSAFSDKFVGKCQPERPSFVKPVDEGLKTSAKVFHFGADCMHLTA